MEIDNYIRTIPDFPKKGISYKDITPLLQDYKAMEFCIKRFAENIKQPIDKVVGIESRGFFFATLLAKELEAGFVPIRKAGKLPFKTLSETCILEYGEDQLEIHRDAINAGENILIHDDVLATGGTAKAACNLVEKLEGKIVQCNFLIELSFLNGREKLNDLDVFSLISY